MKIEDRINKYLNINESGRKADIEEIIRKNGQLKLKVRWWTKGMGPLLEVGDTIWFKNTKNVRRAGFEPDLSGEIIEILTWKDEVRVKGDTIRSEGIIETLTIDDVYWRDY